MLAIVAALNDIPQTNSHSYVGIRDDFVRNRAH
jgi:hypothetical protein